MYEVGINKKSKKFIKEEIEYLRVNGYKPDAYNYGIDDGRVAGQTIPHLHIHVIPRFKGDVDDPVGGVRYIFLEKANYRD
jgi:diadenosine tetraphosphate (Ap4A) HIT family hydrolase